MHFLIDADLPRSVVPLIVAAGHAATDVRDIGLGSAADPLIAAHARSHRLCLLTGDFGFADVRNYPPDQYGGLVVLELPNSATEQTILRLVQDLLAQTHVLNRLPGRLAVVSASRVRLRPP